MSDVGTSDVAVEKETTHITTLHRGMVPQEKTDRISTKLLEKFRARFKKMQIKIRLLYLLIPM